MSLAIGIVIGIATAMILRIAFVRALLFKLRREVAALSRGDYLPLLRGFADHAVLEFNDGDHRWAGTHAGKARIEQFLQEFVGAGLHGEIRHIWISGWPWSMTIAARFDDAADLNGEHLYDNQTVLMCRTRWGKIVHQADYYVDTTRILAFDRALTERGR